MPSSGLNSRKLEDETLFPPGLENKCGGCACNNPCAQAPPPPPPRSPPPPTPKPPSNNCPPPPRVLVVALTTILVCIFT
ncbi:hypothetical protein LIER_35053 [Lithospermum erythrorhizon]|uniref:Uncharacterized protein n=1 Tax=Lithospermum erythrorhizon TaxID=34254 RepID=A0AAV3NK86_LITER